MHAATLWLGTLAALGVSFAWVASRSTPWWPWLDVGLVVGLAAIAAIAASWLVVLALGGRAARGGPAFCGLGIAALALGAARGGDEAARLSESQLAAPRDGLGELRRFVVIGASWPGAQCQVLVRERGAPQRIWLTAPPEVCPLAQGSEISVPATALHVRAGPRWPGDGDARHAAWARGAELALEADALWPSTAPTSSFFTWIAALRQREWERTRHDVAAAFVASSLYGLRVALAPDDRDRLAAAGLGHLVAVSGMQVSLVAFAVYRVLARVLAGLGGSPAWASLGAAVPVVAYVVLCGAEAPAVRAAIMVAAVGLASWSGRPVHGACTLAWTAVAMLAVRPAWALDAGFQLSVVAMAALVRGPVDESLALQSWRVAWAVLPVVALHFGQTGAWAIATNLIAVPIFTIWIVPWGVLAAVTSPWLGAWIHAPAGWGAQLVLDVAGVAAALPPVPIGAAAIVGAIALVLARWPAVRRREAWMRWLPSSLASLGVIAVWLWSQREPPPTLVDADWHAWGGRRHHAVIVPTATEANAACIRDPVGAPVGWPSLLRGLGFGAVHGLEPEGTPHVDDLRERLDREGWWTPADAACRWPAAGAVRRAMAACVARFEPPVLAAARGTAAWCWAGGRWHEAVGYDGAP